MATIGSFKKSENGDYAGAVKTLTLNVKARITPVEKTNDKAPDFRIFAGRGEVEFGAAWRKTSNEGHEYLSLSSTTRASHHRSTPRSSRSKAKIASCSSGRAATAIDRHGIPRAPRAHWRGASRGCIE